jgi:hypothetical protein
MTPLLGVKLTRCRSKLPDDILIGLDMANRMSVLRLIENLFGQWRVIILTCHKAWFEVLKARLDGTGWSHPWRSVTFRVGKAMGMACPVVVAESGTLLIQARIRGPCRPALLARAAQPAEIQLRRTP